MQQNSNHNKFQFVYKILSTTSNQIRAYLKENDTKKQCTEEDESLKLKYVVFIRYLNPIQGGS